MTNPSKDPKFNDALKRMLDAKPKQNSDIKKPRQPKSKPKASGKDPWES